MLRKMFNRKRSVLVLTAVAALAIAGGAFAYFTGTGSGTATGTVGSPSSWAFGSSTLVTGSASTLYPEANGVTQNTDGSPGAVTGANVEKFSYTITNPNGGDQYLTKVHLAIDPTSLPTGCSASDFSINGAAVNTAVDDTSNKGDFTSGQVKTGYLTLEMIDNTSASQNACKAAAPVVDLSAS